MSKYARWRLRCHCTRHKVRVCTEVSFSRNIVGGLGAPPNLKNLPVGQERDIFKTVQTENYSTDDLCSAQLFCGWRALPATKIWIAKNPTWRNCAVLNFLHAVAFRCVTHIHSSQGRMTFSGGVHRSYRASGTLRGWK
jgi:hypothetical protein